MVKEQIKQLEEPAVKRLKDVGGWWIFDGQGLPWQTLCCSNKLKRFSVLLSSFTLQEVSCCWWGLKALLNSSAPHQTQISAHHHLCTLSCLTCTCLYLSATDAVRKIFIELANSSFAGFPNLIKIAKVIIIVILIFCNSACDALIDKYYTPSHSKIDWLVLTLMLSLEFPEIWLLIIQDSCLPTTSVIFWRQRLKP